MYSASPIPIEEFEPDGKLILSSCPGLGPKLGISERGSAELLVDLNQIKQDGVKVVISLLKAEELDKLEIADFPEKLAEHDLVHHWFPIVDRRTPEPHELSALKTLLATTIMHLKTGEPVLVHCHGGLGRSGTFAALLLMELGISAEDAIDKVRLNRPGAIESASQEQLIKGWTPGS